MRRLWILLILAVSLSLVSLTPGSADAPVVGDMELQFNLGWPGPQDTVPDWVGTVTIDGEEYGMAFFNIGSGKPFDDDPNSTVSFFQEIWKIYGDLEYAFDANGVLTQFDEGPVVLWGYDAGVVSLVNSKYRMNGTVEGAVAPFEDLLGNTVHMSGIIEWYPFGAPQYAPGEFRVN